VIQTNTNPLARNQGADDETSGGRTPSLTNAALELAANGWAVFPCRPNTVGEYKAKSPMISNGHLKASRDPGQIRPWWKRWPQAMIGAPVPESLLVVDFDPWKNPDCLAELKNLIGEPLGGTLTAWSGRNDGGHHRYYLRPAGAFTSTRLPVGIDLKVNGYCIVPPSIHPVTGLPYRWEEQAPAPLPWRLRELLRPLPPRNIYSGSRNKSGKPLVDFVARFVTEGVNDALFWAACKAAENGILDEIEQELISTAVSVGESEKQARWTVKSARKRITGEV
jgi:Bifunctional DNA primase/polymerase, N-terminal